MTQTSMALALSGFSFVLTVIWGRPLLRILKELRIGEHIRIDGPDRHFQKVGTPTMGGVLILLPVTFTRGGESVTPSSCWASTWSGILSWFL